MSGNKYLSELLDSQRLDETSSEWEELSDEAARIESIIRAAYPDSDLTLTYGGSRAKGTMIRDDYDLDLVAYFENDDTAPGETLEDIYEANAKLLGKHYTVRRKRSAVRLNKKAGGDLRVDFVSGRYVDETNTDVFIHQNEGKKERLKTNIELHISHVRDSSCTDVIMLSKFWKGRMGIGIKTFPLELLVIAILVTDNGGNLEQRFIRVLTAFTERIEEIKIEDPANPTGNDLSHALSEKLRKQLAKIAADTLTTAHEYGWEHIFGKIEVRQATMPRIQALRSAAASVSVPTKPWGGELD